MQEGIISIKSNIDCLRFVRDFCYFSRASFVPLPKRTLMKVSLQQSAIFANQSITQSPLFHNMHSVATTSQHGYNLIRKIMYIHVHFSLYFRGWFLLPSMSISMFISFQILTFIHTLFTFHYVCFCQTRLIWKQSNVLKSLKNCVATPHLKNLKTPKHLF